MNNGINILPADEPSIHGIYRWGIAIIKGIQTIESPGLTTVIRIITGTVYAYTLIVLFIFWCVDEKKGLRMGIILLVSAWINSALKLFLRQPRPYQLDPSVGRAFESSYGLPSGHAQISLVFWMSLAGKWLARPAVWAAAVLISLVIGLSRLYLGVHFPTDLLAGWLLGALTLGGFFILDDPINRVLNAGGTRLRMISCAAAAFLMNALRPGDVRYGAVFLGFGAGYSLMLRYFPVSIRGMIRGKGPGTAILGTRYVLGLAGAAALYFGFRTLLEGLPGDYRRLGLFILYSALGFWVSAGAPWLFLKFGLAAPGSPGEGGNPAKAP